MPEQLPSVDSDALRATFEALAALNPRWGVDVGMPEGTGWVQGDALCDAEAGPFAELLSRIQARMRTGDRKIAAAAFALRFGWSSAVVIGPMLSRGIVPDVKLENIALRFSEATLYEGAALLHPRIAATAQDRQTLFAAARVALDAQTALVVRALRTWSRLPSKVLWGQITSSWCAQFEPLLAALGHESEARAAAHAFGDAATGPAADAWPALYVVEHRGVHRLHHCRATCCLYYKIEGGGYCASCPLISEAQRLARNKAWIERTLL